MVRISSEEYNAIKQRLEGSGQPVTEKKRNKYGAEIVEVDGIKFRSSKEAQFYCGLKLRQKDKGDVSYFLMQVPFTLPGGVRYMCDFQIFYSDGSVSYIDTKGFRTRSFIDKKKQVEALFPVKIEER